MSIVSPLLLPERVHCHVTAASRKRLLQQAALTITGTEFSADQIFDELMNRERLGSTGLGDGVAIPHCRCACAAIQVSLITTTQPVDYEAADGNPVDIFFVVVVPHEENQAHLTVLAELAQIFSDPENCSVLRNCRSDTELHAAMQQMLGSL